MLNYARSAVMETVKLALILLLLLSNVISQEMDADSWRAEIGKVSFINHTLIRELMTKLEFEQESLNISIISWGQLQVKFKFNSLTRRDCEY